MKTPLIKSMLLVAPLSLMLIAGCGGGGSAEDEDTPEAAAFRFRDAVMTLLAAKALTVGGMARGDIAVDEAEFSKSVNDLAALSGMLVEGFMPEGMPNGSRAMPEIWQNWDDFAKKAGELESATMGLAEASNNGGFSAAQGLVQGTISNCGACHRAYRKREE